jgi:hypothetical protein
MDRADVFGCIVLVLTLGFQLWVTRKVFRSDAYEPAQKRAQAKLIWLVPVLGALVAFSMLEPESKGERVNDDRDQRY